MQILQYHQFYQGIFRILCQLRRRWEEYIQNTDDEMFSRTSWGFIKERIHTENTQRFICTHNVKNTVEEMNSKEHHSTLAWKDTSSGGWIHVDCTNSLHRNYENTDFRTHIFSAIRANHIHEYTSPSKESCSAGQVRTKDVRKEL